MIVQTRHPVIMQKTSFRTEIKLKKKKKIETIEKRVALFQRLGYKLCQTIIFGITS